MPVPVPVPAPVPVPSRRDGSAIWHEGHNGAPVGKLTVATASCLCYSYTTTATSTHRYTAPAAVLVFLASCSIPFPWPRGTRGVNVQVHVRVRVHACVPVDGAVPLSPVLHAWSWSCWCWPADNGWPLFFVSAPLVLLQQAPTATTSHHHLTHTLQHNVVSYHKATMHYINTSARMPLPSAHLVLAHSPSRNPRCNSALPSLWNLVAHKQPATRPTHLRHPKKKTLSPPRWVLRERERQKNSDAG